MNEPIRTIIIDDENQSRIVLKKLLSNFPDDIEVVGVADNADLAYKLINEKKPALIFLDIQMPRGDGFTLLKRFSEIQFEIIFVTSYDKYAISAIKFSALDYLLKPVEMSDLKNAISKARSRIKEKITNKSQIINLLHNLNSAVSQSHQFIFQSGDEMKVVKSEDIVSIESEGSYSKIITVTNERFITAKYLKDFEDYFGESPYFIRIHRGCLLNTRQIKGYSIGEPCIITMSNGEYHEVSRRKKQEVLEKLRK